jgi:hypothetical protein
MRLKHHFKLNLGDAKQLFIAFVSAGIPWACRGFAHDPATLWYTFGGFITGGLVSHNSSSSPNIMPESHIQTPYANNINDGSSGVPPQFSNVQSVAQQTFQNVKIIPKNDKTGDL